MGSVMAKTNTPAPSLGPAIAELLRSLSAAFFDSYRPELHYMRGPGPKWREKNGIAAPRPEPAAISWRHSPLERFTPNARNTPIANLACSAIGEVKHGASLQTGW
jgi:hypothetical protein